MCNVSEYNTRYTSQYDMFRKIAMKVRPDDILAQLNLDVSGSSIHRSLGALRPFLSASSFRNVELRGQCCKLWVNLEK